MHLTAVAVVLLLARRNGASVGLAMLGPGDRDDLSGLTVLRARLRSSSSYPALVSTRTAADLVAG
jgi:hypothetical protein